MSEPFIDPTNYMEPWYRALSSPWGIAIVSNDRDRALQRLYVERAKSDDKELKKLKLMKSPTSANEIWIIKK